MHFYETLRLTLEGLWDGYLTFSILLIISDIEKRVGWVERRQSQSPWDERGT